MKKTSNPSDQLHAAATVLLVRDRVEPGDDPSDPAKNRSGNRDPGKIDPGKIDPGKIEVFMEKRHLSSTFVGGAYVFPGGRVDQEDSHNEDRCCNLTAAQADTLLGTKNSGQHYFVAALRECFEEAGVLLAYDRSGDLLDFRESKTEAVYRDARDQLNAKTLTFPELLAREDLQLATDRMHYWSHWITPVGEKRRYDTRFFISAAPPNQTATHDDWELTSSAWVEPRVALEKAMAGEWFIIFPTLHTLVKLDELGNTKAALAWAQGDHHRPINRPKLLNDGPVLPGDPGYETAQDDITGTNPALWMSYFQR